MAHSARKQAVAPAQARRYLEPGPVVPVPSQHGAARAIMAMGRPTVMESGKRWPRAPG